MSRHWDFKRRELDRLMNRAAMLEKYASIDELHKLMVKITIELRSFISKPITLDDVIEFKTNGFTVNIDAMASDQVYRFKFEGSAYEMYRNNNDELVMGEIPSTNE